MTGRDIAGRLESILADDSEGWGAVARLADEVRAGADAEASHDVPDCPVCVAKGRALADAEWRGVAETALAEAGAIRAERDGWKSYAIAVRGDFERASAERDRSRAEARAAEMRATFGVAAPKGVNP